MNIAFEVARDDLHRARRTAAPLPALEPGQALLEVERFGLSANNVTYAVLGHELRYWELFPAAAGWGRIPAWGFARVTASAHDDLPEGLRVFGLVPMATHLLCTPGAAGATGFVDRSPHRRELAPSYNLYRAVDADPGYASELEDEQMVLRPLFFLSFVLDDFVADSGSFGADTVVLSSASSKAALGTAFLLADRDVEVVGLTSPGNVAALQDLGVYDQVVAYDDVDALPGDRAVFLDLAGDAAIRHAVHRRYGDALAHSAAVGLTHLPEAGGDDAGATPFFAPDRIRMRVREWGAAEFDARFARCWEPFVRWSASWLQVERGNGPDAVEAAYRAVLDGRARPHVGLVLSLWR